jgi:hypothetical protein
MVNNSSANVTEKFREQAADGAAATGEQRRAKLKLWAALRNHGMVSATKSGIWPRE